MRAALERWAQLEPERCSITAHAVDLAAPFAFRIHWVMLDADPINRAALFTAVIEAIEARGWEWNVGTTMQPPVQAYVTTPKRRHLSTRAATPAEALLRAYLTALEAEREVTP